MIRCGRGRSHPPPCAETKKMKTCMLHSSYSWLSHAGLAKVLLSLPLPHPALPFRLSNLVLVLPSIVVEVFHHIVVVTIIMTVTSSSIPSLPDTNRLVTMCTNKCSLLIFFCCCCCLIFCHYYFSWWYYCYHNHHHHVY